MPSGAYRDGRLYMGFLSIVDDHFAAQKHSWYILVHSTCPFRIAESLRVKAHGFAHLGRNFVLVDAAAVRAPIIKQE